MRHLALGVVVGTLALGLGVACGGGDEKKPAADGSGGSGGSSSDSGGSGGGGSSAGGSGAGGGSSTSSGGGGATSGGGSGGSGGSASSSGGAAGEAGASSTAGGAAGASVGGGGEAGANPDSTTGSQSCAFPESFSCAEFAQQIAGLQYDANVPEIIITFDESFPNIKSVDTDGDYGLVEGGAACAYGSQMAIDPPSRTLHVPWPTFLSPTDLFLRNLTFVDECDRTLSLDPGTGCLEPRFWLTTGVSFECVDDPYDADCTWDCG